MEKKIINSIGFVPKKNKNQRTSYVMITSMGLGGAERIVANSLWENHRSADPDKITLIIQYHAEREYPIPPSVNVVRLNGKTENAIPLFKQIAFEEKTLALHLIGDKAALLAAECGCHVVFCIHNDSAGWKNSISTYNSENVVGLIAVADEIRRHLVEAGVKKEIIVIRTWIGGGEFSFSEEKRISSRNLLGFSDEDFVIGMIGRISPQKNYPLAVEILKSVKKLKPEAKLAIIGGFQPNDEIGKSEYVKIIKKICEFELRTSVKFIGFSEIPQDFVNAFDVGLNCSFFEGLSIGCQEMLANGLSVAASKVGGQSEIVVNDERLSFFDIDSEQVVAEAADILVSFRKRTSITTENEDKITRYRYASSNLWNIVDRIPHDVDFSHVAFITSNLNLGGAQRSLTNLLAELADMDIRHPLAVLNQSNQTSFYETLMAKGVETFLCSESRDVFDISRNLFSFFSANRIGTVVFWNVDFKMKAIISKLSKGLLKIIDVSPGDYIFDEADSSEQFLQAISYSQREYFESLERFVSKCPISRSQAFDKMEFLKKPPITIKNGVFPSSVKRPAVPSEYFAVSGRIAPSKRIEIVLRAFRLFLSNYPNQKIRLYGTAEPRYSDYLHDLNLEFSDLFDSGSASWNGQSKNPTEDFSDCEAVIILGTKQGSPNSALEAAAAMIPVIANDSGGTSDSVGDGAGWLISENSDEFELLNAMNEVKSNPKEASKRAETAFLRIQSEFSMSSMANSYIEIMEDAANG